MDEALFVIGGNHNLWEVKEAQAKLIDYTKKRGKDPQINDVLIILEIFALENEYGDYEASYELAKPIFERLFKLSKWSFYDIRIFASVVDCCSYSFEKIGEYAETALKMLEVFSHEQHHEYVKLVIHMNMTFRLLRFSYFDEDVRSIPANFKKLETMFLFHADAILAMPDNEKILLPKAITLVRKGTFYRGRDQVEEGLKILSELDNDKAYMSIEKEIKEFESSERLTSEAKELNTKIGNNIRKIRHTNKISEYELSRNLGFTVSNLNLIEEGRRSISAYHLMKLSDILNVSLETICSEYDEQHLLDSPPQSHHREGQIKRLADGALLLPDDELDHMVYLVENSPRGGLKKG